MPGLRIVAAKPGEDVRTGKQADMSFDSNLNLQKIVKCIHGTGNENIAHGLAYPPEILVMEKVATNRTVNITEVNYGSAGTTTYWYCPSGVTSITVKAWGGGGAGGGITTDNVDGSGGGGAGGQFVQKTISVTPGTTYAITIGAVAIGTTGNGANGADVVFGNNLVVAKGGAGGKSYENGGAGGIGSTAGGVGDIVYKGGNGNGYHLDGSGYETGGEGGGGAGTTGNGGDALGNSYPDPGGLGTAVGGGNGAPGVPVPMDGLSGSRKGGGGGGGMGGDYYTTDRKGGNGGYPDIEFSYTRTLDNPEYMANVRGSALIDSTNFFVSKSLESYPWYAPTTNIWTHILLDPIKAPVGTITPIKKDIPVIKVFSEEEGESDYKNKLNTFYDSLKVFKTGTMTINAPEKAIDSTKSLEDIIEVTVAHNLGYVPMFAPFVPSPILLNNYVDWLNQYGGMGEWAIGVNYSLGRKVSNAGIGYRCIRSHTSSASTEPGAGVDWEDYWEVYTSLSYDNLSLNEFEDVKYRFGGVELFDYAMIEYYATTTDLVFRLTRVAYNWGQYMPGDSTGPLSAVNISVDYTIFYNRADEEFNLLS